MNLTRLGHACTLIESSSTRILIDPGNFSDSWHRLGDLDVVLITHAHHDHIDPDHIEKVLEGNPDAKVIVERGVVGMLGERDSETATVGDRLNLGDISVEVVGGEHAVIHERIPRVGNVGFVIREGSGPSLFHPGDSYATVPSGVDVLALPLSAPWGRVSMTIDFANAVRPTRIVPIHDGTLSERGRAVYMRMSRSVIDESITIDDAAQGEAYEI